MSRRYCLICLAVPVICVVFILGGIGWANGQMSQDVERSPEAIFGPGFTYQGQLKIGDEPVTDECGLEFRLYENDTGNIQVGNPITMTAPITNGLFTVILNEGGEFGGSAFNGERRWLGVKVKCQNDIVFSELGLQELTAAPYALFARSAASLRNNPVSPAKPSVGEVLKWNGALWGPDRDAGDYSNVIIVAKDGGDFASIQMALDSIVDNTAGNPYLVWVAPGVYTETVTMKSYVDIHGAGAGLSIISSQGTNASDQGTVNGAADCKLSHVSVRNVGANSYAIGFYNSGNAGLTVSNISLHVSGGTLSNIGFYNKDGGASLTVKDTNVYLEDLTNSATAFLSYNSSGDHNLNLFNVKITAIQGAAGNYTGISGNGSASGVAAITADNVTIDLETTGNAYGISSYHNSQINVYDSTIMITGGTNKGIGIQVGTNSTVSRVNVDHSTIHASYKAVQIDGVLAHEVKIASSMLVGLIDEGDYDGTVTCVGCYDENYENSTGFTSCP